MAENAKWLDSIEGKTYQFTNALETMWSNMISSDMTKGFIDFGTKVIQFLDTIPGKITAILAAASGFAKFKGISLLGLGQEAVQSLKSLTAAQSALQTLGGLNITGPTMNAASIQAYAAAVSNLTAKQQANMLASAGLTKAQIQLALQYNGLSDDVIREATAHVFAKQAKDQENMSDAELLKNKILLSVASLKLKGDTDSLAVSEYLEANASELAAAADAKQMIMASGLTVAQKAAALSALGLADANMGLAASFGALFASNPIGIILTIISLIPIAATLFGDSFKSVEEKMQDLQTEWSELTNKISNTSRDFKQLKSSADSVIPRFSKLAKGVDKFGKNVNLTDAEYEEFLSLNNQLAEMFPEINNGMDENGNAMLSLSYNANTLEDSLWALVDAKRAAANEEIADTMPDAAKNVKETVKLYNKEKNVLQNRIDAYKQAQESMEDFNTDAFKQQYKELYGDNWEEQWKIAANNSVDIGALKIAYGADSDIEGWNNLLDKFTIDGQIDWRGVLNSAEMHNAIAGVETQFENIQTKIQNKWNQLNPIVSAWANTDYDYQGLDSDLQSAAQAMMGNIDFSKYDTADEIKDHIKTDILQPLDDLTPEAQKKLSKLMSIDTKDLSVAEYQEKVKQAADEFAAAQDKWSASDILKNTGYQENLDAIDNVIYKIEQLKDVDINKEQLLSLDADQISQAFDIVKDYGIKSFEDLQEALNKKTFEVNIDIAAEQEGFDALQTAIDEATSAAGMSAESIDKIEARYRDLAGYNHADMFEETAHGIKLNASALRELEKEYNSSNADKLDAQLADLTDQYNELSAEIATCTDASERANLYRQRQNVLDQINDTATLAAQYRGLASAYNQWQRLKGGSSNKDTYEGVVTGIKDMKEAMSGGWMDEWQKSFVDMFTNTDTSGWSTKQYIDEWTKLRTEVVGAGHTVMDFFTTDDDGNATSKGVYNLLEAIKAVKPEVVKANEAGKEYLDFSGIGDKAVADALNVSEELLHIILNAGKSAGLEVNLESAYTDLADFKDHATEVNEQLKALGATDYTFNINSMDINDVEEQIKEAHKALNNLVNEDGTLKVDVADYENAKALLATLISQKQILEQPAILKVNTEEAQVGTEVIIKTLQEFKSAYNEWEVKLAVGEDTTEAKAKLDTAMETLRGQDPEIMAKLGIDPTQTAADINTALLNITPEIMVNAGLDTSLIEGYQAAEHTAEGTVIWDNNVKKVTDWMARPKIVDGEVEWDNNVDKVKTFFEAKGVINFEVVGFANGTAHVGGTARAGGDWGAKKTETALVGELGPEILVRGSRWTTIGENGAEFTQVKKGDIIFNHKQTEEILKNGYVTGRGKLIGGAFAGGTDGTISTNGDIDNELKKYIHLLNQYDQDVRDAVNSSNEYVKNLDDKYKKYGNIDNADRNIVWWNDEAFKKHYSYIADQARREGRNVDEYYDTELRDTWSTVLGTSGSFGFNGKQFEIAYSQMLNDGGETILLTFEELTQYVFDLMEKSLVNGEVSPDKMMELDAIGLEKEIQSKLVTVKDMLAGVEGQIVDGVALTIDDILAMAHPTIDPDTGKSNELGKKINSIYEGFSMHDIQAESLFGEFTKQYGGVSEAFLQLEELSYQYGMTLDDLVNKLYNLQLEINTANKLYNNTVRTVYTSNNLQSPGWTRTPGSSGRYAMLHGNAFAEGSGGAPKTETALVGELGPELLVRGNQWTTVGDNGAEFTQVKKGDVIFNHKQTRELLKNGHTSSRGKLKGGNSAFAHGTSYLFEIGAGGGAGTIEKTEAVQKEMFDKFAAVVSNAADTIEKATTVSVQPIDYGSRVNTEVTYEDIVAASGADDTGKGSGSGNKDDDKDKETFDWIEVKLEEINEKIGLTEAKLENASNLTEQNSTIDELISIHQDLYDNLIAGEKKYHEYAETLLAKIPAEYRDIAKDGTIAIEEFVGDADKETLEAIQNYREWTQKAADAAQQAEETLTAIRDLAIQQFDNAREAGDVKVAIEDSQIEKLQNAVDFDEASGIITSDAYYIAMMKDVDDKIKLLTEAKNNMQKEFNDLMTSVPNFVGSNAYYEKLNEMYEMDSEIANARIELEEFQNAINDLDVERFDQLIARLDYVQKDTQNLIDLMSDEDMFVKPEGQTYEGGTVKFWKEEDVAWTDEGLATLGLYAQQMEVAKAGAAACAEQIQKLKDAYAAGKLSENEYLEQLSELTGQQVDFEKTAKDSFKAIHDLKSEQIDYIKQGIEKETEAYEELINKKKENLREDKNARDFQRSVSDKQKEIDDLERRIAVLSNNNSAWAKGELARLNAELAEKKQDMTDLYDDHALELEEKALDDSYESVKNANEAKIEELDKFLENYELVIEDTYTVIKANAERIGATLTETTEEYNLTVSDAVLSPWKDGAFAIGIYQEKFDAATSSTTSKLNDIRDAWQEVIDKTQEAGDANVAQFNKDNAAYTVSEQKQPVAQNKPTTTASGGGIYTVKRGDTLWGIAASKLGSGARWQEIYNLNKDVISNPDLIQPGWKLKLPKYAKGTTGIKNNQLAILDELGDELQLVPDGNGRLAYMTKGTSVIPHDITENLMTLGQLDPQDIIDRNRPVISAPHVSTNETVISIEYGDILHIDNYSGDKPENLSKLIDKAFDKHMKQLNSEIRKFTR